MNYFKKINQISSIFLVYTFESSKFEQKYYKMSLLTVGSVAFDAIETPFGKTDKIIGGAGTYIALAASFYKKTQHIHFIFLVHKYFHGF